MRITEIRIKLAREPRGALHKDRLRAFASVTIDDSFAVRDLKIIEGRQGLFIAMPSRKIEDHCPRCGHKNQIRARFCNDCGCRLGSNREQTMDDGRLKLHADIAYPINAETRALITRAVLDAYEAELEATSGLTDEEISRRVAMYDAA